MPDLFDLLTQLVGERPWSTFATLLVAHIATGLTTVVAGATAMLSPKRRGRHPKGTSSEGMRVSPVKVIDLDGEKRHPGSLSQKCHYPPRTLIEVPGTCAITLRTSGVSEPRLNSTMTRRPYQSLSDRQA